MAPELLVRMFTEIDNVTMVKESTGDLSRMLRLAELTGGALSFYNGSNPLALQALAAGAAGWCTAAPNLRPQPCLDLYAAVRAGDTAAAQAIYDDLAPLLRFIVDGGLPTTVKAGLDLLGRGVGDPRPPLLPLDPARRADLQTLLATG
jgi:4-hydroxy-tetrahydrodipicolinate synthase